MNKAITLSLIAALSLASSAAVLAARPPAKGPDLSGVYDCKGKDAHEGDYEGVVTLERVAEQSTSQHTAYRFKLEVPGFGTYLGHGAGRGTQVALYFALSDPAQKDFGTGIADFRKTKTGKWRFEKYYYEPEYKGGNYGTEICIQR